MLTVFVVACLLRSQFPGHSFEIVYINLDSRVDRRVATTAMLNSWKYPYERIPGVVKGPGKTFADKQRLGALGCTLSHLAALSSVKNRDIFILEDDLEFSSTPPLAELNNSQAWDVVCLAHNTAKVDTRDCFVAGGHRFCRATNAQTTSAYLVRRKHVDLLRWMARESAVGLQSGGAYEKFAYDQAWKKAQHALRWYVAYPRLARQRRSWSDIEHRVVDYGA